MKFNMYNKKNQRLFVIIIAAILILAMVIPTVAYNIMGN